ncbi:beta-ketoacyl-[acyl-carrier-protein] synthase family protein [Aquimonas sp.]|uniref:beta-ketoacyl-[acyl-carrier-protein] synthase family protein n=1 Tax=Aquimonas sp. TaxID=1872588 RepID=UPI0037BE7D48
MPPLAITARTATTACGPGLAALSAAVAARRSGLRRNDFSATALETWIGRVDGLESVELPEHLFGWDCRNNRLAWFALQQDGLADKVAALIERYGAARVALIIGTSTSSIGASEEAYARLDGDRFPADLDRPIIHTPHSLGSFLAAATGLRGPCVTVATACSSSAKVFAQAARLIHAGVVDAALVGGVDTLCGSVLFGFNALGLVSSEQCRPFDVARRGLSLGEAGGYAILEREGAGPRLLGYGESSDAHHMSSPHPDGLGARLCMQAAITRAGLAPEQVDYLNLHGTATPINDQIEAGAVARLFGEHLRASSTKAYTGHTLGAAGIVESLLALSTIDSGLLPGTLNCDAPDPACGPQILRENTRAEVRIAMNNSFGFGGNNCSLVFGAEARA